MPVKNRIWTRAFSAVSAARFVLVSLLACSILPPLTIWHLECADEATWFVIRICVLVLTPPMLFLSFSAIKNEKNPFWAIVSSCIAAFIAWPFLLLMLLCTPHDDNGHYQFRYETARIHATDLDFVSYARCVEPKHNQYCSTIYLERPLLPGLKLCKLIENQLGIWQPYSAHIEDGHYVRLLISTGVTIGPNGESQTLPW
jgi:hypothetical protein